MRAAVAVALALVVLAGCGEEEDRRTLVEDAIADLVGADAVTCPDGDAVTCQVSVEDQALEVPVVIDEDDEVTLEAAVVAMAEVVEFLESELTRAAAAPVSVDCGTESVVVRRVGETITCSAVREHDARAFDVAVAVVDLSGELRYTATRIPVPPVLADPPTP